LAWSDYNTSTPHNKAIKSPFYILKITVVSNWQLAVEYLNQKLEVLRHTLALSCIKQSTVITIMIITTTIATTGYRMIHWLFNRLYQLKKLLRDGYGC
jgi:hypothetical protein